MPNSIALIQKYIDKLDDVYKVASLTSDLEANPATVRMGNNAREILVAKMDMDGLGDYSRNGGYVDGFVNLEWESKEFNYDRGRRLTVDTMDNEETAHMSFGLLAGEFIRTKVAPEMDAWRFAKYSEEIYKIAEAYDKAYESAYNSISNQFSLFSEAKNDADATFGAFMNATDSQLDFWDTYNKNLETLKSKSYKDLGITEENYNLLLDLAAKTDTESQSLINSILINGDTAIAEAANRLGELKEAHKEAATNQATELTGIEDELKKHVDNIKDAIKKLELGSESQRYAEGTMDKYIRGIEGKIEKARKSAQSLVDAVKNTFESADLTLTMSVVSTSASGSVQVEGNAKGTTNSADVFIAGEEGPELIVGKKGSTVFPFSETAKIVNAVSSMIPGADSAVAATMNIMNAQGASSVSAYSPVYREVYNPSSASPVAAQPASVPDLHPTINVTVNLGNGEFRDYVIDTVTDANANSGGWSV